MKFPPDYPDQPPAIKLKNPRGLGEDFLANALKLCHEKCDHFSGSPVIYEIIEVHFKSIYLDFILLRMFCMLSSYFVNASQTATGQQGTVPSACLTFTSKMFLPTLPVTITSTLTVYIVFVKV